MENNLRDKGMQDQSLESVMPTIGGEGGEQKASSFDVSAPTVSLPKGGGAIKGIDEKEIET